MEPLLQENRERRLIREKESRRRSRTEKFPSIWTALNRQTVPYLTLEEPEGSDPFAVNKIVKPYPEALTALQWPVIAEIMEMDITSDEMRQKLSDKRGEIQAMVRGWRKEFETELAELLWGQSDFETDAVIKTEPMDSIGACVSVYTRQTWLIS